MENSSLDNIIKYKDEINPEAMQNMIDSLQQKVSTLNEEINHKKQVLEDINKPILKQDDYNLLIDAITDGIDNTSFEQGNFDWEPEFCGKEVQLNYITFEGQEYLLEAIQTAIESMFKIVQEEDEQENSFENE